MQVRKKEARILRRAITAWADGGLVDEDLAGRLSGSIEEIAFDWKRLAAIAFLVAVLCLAVSVISLFADDYLMELIQRLISVSALGKVVFFAVLAALFYGFGARRMKARPHLRFSNEAILFLGVLSTAVAVYLLGDMVSSDDPNVSYLVLLSFLIYAAVGYGLGSNLIWLFALLSLGGWLGAETGYASGWGAYYLGMNYPLRFVLFGGLLTLAAVSVPAVGRFKELHKATLVMGLLYLFVSLWLMSIFGNYGDMDSWGGVHQMELFHWSILFALASGAAIFAGLRRDDGILRGFGLTFLLINLYTRYFELFWDATHKVVFFALMAASFWLLGRKAESIWTLGGRVKRERG